MRMRVASAGLVLAFSIQPAAAQIFWLPPVFAGAPIAPGEAGVGVSMPGATPEEQRASLAWQLRSGLNVMALQCQFDRTLLTEANYNTLLTNHKIELDTAYAKIAAYFKRVTKSAALAQKALDSYGTKSYLSMSTVRGQLGFCQTASNITKQAIFAPRGGFTQIAIDRLRELRNSLILAGEQQFRFPIPRVNTGTPLMDDRCWKRDSYRRECGSVAF